MATFGKYFSDRHRESKLPNNSVKLNHLVGHRADIDMGATHLTSKQQEQLQALLMRVPQLFPADDGPLRTSAVKHNILTEGPPIRQKFRCILEAIKPTSS